SVDPAVEDGARGVIVSVVRRDHAPLTAARSGAMALVPAARVWAAGPADRSGSLGIETSSLHAHFLSVTGTSCTGIASSAPRTWGRSRDRRRGFIPRRSVQGGSHLAAHPGADRRPSRSRSPATRSRTYTARLSNHSRLPSDRIEHAGAAQIFAGALQPRVRKPV